MEGKTNKQVSSVDSRQYTNTDRRNNSGTDRVQGQLTGFDHSLSLRRRSRGNVGQSPGCLKLERGAAGEGGQNQLVGRKENNLKDERKQFQEFKSGTEGENERILLKINLTLFTLLRLPVQSLQD